jgi:hypothetical protein
MTDVLPEEVEFVRAVFDGLLNVGSLVRHG